MGSGSKPMIYTSEFSRPAIWTHAVYPYFYTIYTHISHIAWLQTSVCSIRIDPHCTAILFWKRLRCCDGLLQPTFLDWHHGIQTPLQAPVSSDRVHSGPSGPKRVLTCFNTNTAIIWWLKLLVDPLQAHSFLPQCPQMSWEFSGTRQVNGVYCHLIKISNWCATCLPMNTIRQNDIAMRSVWR